MKIYVLGSNGMLGRYVYTYFKHENYDVVGLTRKELDVLHLREGELRAKLFHLGLRKGDVVINCIGMIKQRTDIDDIDFIYINSLFPRLLANVCQNEECKMIHPTTDCVFNGLGGKYTESNIHNATDVYGKTKSLGEPKNATVIRTSIIGEEIGQSRSLVEWVKSNKGKTVNGYVNHLWNGITCLQFAKVCKSIIDNNIFWDGVRHICSNTLSKFELVNRISQIYDLDVKVDYFKTPIKCDRSLSSMYNNIFNIPSLHKQIEEMKDYYQILKNN